MAFRKTKLAIAVSGSLALAACGGGGGGPFIKPGSAANTYSFSLPSFGAIFSAQQEMTDEQKEEVADAVEIFKFVSDNSFSDLNIDNDKIVIDGVERTLEEGYQVLQGLTKQLYTETTKEFWDNAASTGTFDNEDSVYIGISDALAEAPNTPTEMFNYFMEIGKGAAEPVDIVVNEPQQPAIEDTPAEDESAAPVLTLLNETIKEMSDVKLSSGTPLSVTEEIDETRVSTDANGSTVTEVYTIYTTTTTIPVTKTTTIIKKQLKTWSDGTTTEEVIDKEVTTVTEDKVTVSHTESTEPKSRIVTPNKKGHTDTDSSVDEVTHGEAVVTTTSVGDTRVSTDANGSTVTEVYTIYTDTTTVPVTTTTTVTTTRTTSWTDGTTTQEVINVTSTDNTVDEVTTTTREEFVSRTVTANVKNTWEETTEDVVVTLSDFTSTSPEISEEAVEYLDSDGNTVREVYLITKTTSTTPRTTTTTLTTTEYTSWTDGTVTSEVVDVSSTDVADTIVDVTTERVLASTTTTPNVVSITESQTSEEVVTNEESTATTVQTTETRDSLDADGNTVTEVYNVFTTTTITPVRTTTIVTDYRTTLYTNGDSVTEPTNVDSSYVIALESVKNVIEEFVSRTVTPNVKSSYTQDVVTSTSVTEGEPVVTNTTSVNETRTSTDANGSTVTEVYTIYTDTLSTPVTTTTVTDTQQVTLWTDGTTSTLVTATTSTDSVTENISTATREELVSRTVTANQVSYSDEESTSTTTVVSDPVLQETITNRDTRADGVWYFYYDIWVTTTTATITTTTTRTTLYTDGTSTTEVVNVDTTETVTTSEQVKVRIQAPDTVAEEPEAPESSAGTVVVQESAPTLDYDPDTYSAATYYGSDSSSMGTPTAVDSHDPADFSTIEFDNGANSEINANYAYARGWTGKGSTVMIMDTGVDTDHVDLVDKIKYEWDPGYDNGIEDTHGHGTHVAGIVAAAKNDTGMHGVAYDADLAIAKIGTSSASMFYARKALNWAKQHDDIVAANLSANMYSSYQNITDQGNGVFTVSNDIDDAIGTNAWASAMPEELVLTMSAGNASYDYSAAPTPIATATDADGNLKLDGRVLIVGNWNKTTNTIDGGKAGHVCRDYTNGTCNDAYVTSDFYILAPGIAVNSTYKDGAYKEMSGTSMASPVVAGAVAIVHQLWPYMQGKNIAQLLLQTADKNLPNYSKVTHGAGLLDLEKATRPVGDLGISLTGRTGTTAELSGSLSANIDTGVLASVSAVDELDRDFTVDLTPGTVSKSISMSQSLNAERDGWGASIANLNTKQVGDFRFGASEDTKNVTLGYTTPVAKNLDLTLSYTHSEESPWIGMSGMYGEVTGSNTIDATAKYKFSKNFTAQVGLMSTNTDIKSGIVQDVDNVQAAYAGVSYKEYMKNKDTVSVYAGVKPYALSGSVKLRVPTGVDANGVMQYEEVDSKVKTLLEGYAGVNYVNNVDDMTSTTWSLGADSAGGSAVGVTLRHTFW
jgi:subtilisin family serine protease